MNENLIRIFDILISSFVLITLSPLLIIIAFIILIFNGRLIIFKQKRVSNMVSNLIFLNLEQ